jgi:hypothetical protein
MKKLSVVKRRHMPGTFVVLIACLAVPSVPMHAQQSKSAVTLEALAAKVKRLEDVQEITDVLIAYGRALDTRDFKWYSSLFAKDGSWSGGMGKVTGGPQAVYDFMIREIGGGGQRNANGGGNGSAAPAPQRPIGPGSTYHIMSNFKIDVSGDKATASSRWTFVSAARGPGIQLAGRYEDTLVREDGTWKFKSREAFNDVIAPAAAPPASGARSAPPAGGR